MLITDLGLDGVKLVHLKVHGDGRGYFMETYRDSDWRPILGDRVFIQDNQSMSTQPGTLRGLHYQCAPFAQGKLVQPVRGRIYDVAVDLRSGSPSFLKWSAVEIDEMTSFYIPQGCAHGFQALTDEVHLIYQHSTFYDPANEGGVRYDDPAIGVRWPLAIGTVSDRDQSFDLIDDSFEGLAL